MPSGIRERLDALHPRQGFIGADAKLQRVSKSGGVILELWKLLPIDRMKIEGDRLSVRFFFGISNSPAAIVPVAQFHPANIGATRFAVLGQMLVRPPAAPIFQAQTFWHRTVRG